MFKKGQILMADAKDVLVTFESMEKMTSELEFADLEVNKWENLYEEAARLLEIGCEFGVIKYQGFVATSGSLSSDPETVSNVEQIYGESEDMASNRWRMIAKRTERIARKQMKVLTTE